MIRRRYQRGQRGLLLAMHAVLVQLVAAPAAQQTPPQTSFRYERPVQTGGSGPRRLPIDVTLLAGSQADQPSGQFAGLNDLRFFDPAGREVPYLLVGHPSETPQWRSVQTLPGAAVETPTQKTSAFDVDFGQAITLDRFRIDGLAPQTLKRVRLEGSGDRARWTLLVSEGTVFNLPDEQLLQAELAFTPGAYRYIRLSWDDTRSGQVPRPAFASAREVRDVVPPPELTTAVSFERRASEPGRSHVRVRLPAARLPIVALDVELGGTHVLRDATVYEARLTGGQIAPNQLGRALLKRIVRDDVTAASLRIPITPPGEPQLDLVIDDGTNPPSDVQRITAVFATLPWIYFESPGDAIVARYGSPSLKAPRYDLEAVRESLAIGATPIATWGESRARAESENPAVGVAALPTVGSTLDPASFRYVRSIPSGAAGLITIPLDEAVLAHSRGEVLSDVRVLDAANRQVPYLIERASEPLSLDVTIEPVTTRPASLPSDPAVSVYRARLPLEQLPPTRLVLTTPARVFTRRVTVGVEHAPTRGRREPWFERLETKVWSHADQESDPPALTLTVRPLDGRELIVTIDDGDNSPLAIASARVLLPSYRLRLFRERDAMLRLVYGRDDLSPPQYDLALLATQLTGAAATEVTAGPEPARVAESEQVLMSPQVFWGVLIVAVLVLLALVVRLMRKADVQSTPA